MSISAAELAAYAHMQARLVDLLLRHDQQRFERYYGAQAGYQSNRDTALALYRQLGVLFLLRDELFEHILPRIVRRLSFESPRSTIIEEPPPRGRVDWERTLAANWQERPGEPPLMLHTRQRRRDFATPENLLTVATLLSYAAEVQRLLLGDYAVIGAEALRHPLGEIITRCERELAFPQFAGLRAQAQQILERNEAEQLEQQVHERLLPGGNSAYEELLAWRLRYRDLQLLHRLSSDPAEETLGADPQRDNYLYQLWLFYELADLLQRSGRLSAWDHASMSLLFEWGQGADRRSYRLTHDRGLAHDWPKAPGVRPDLYIAHAEPQVVRAGKQLIWREPGFVLDAKYYKPRDHARAPASPIKRMIADLALTAEQHGALLFAFLQPEQPLLGEEERDPEVGSTNQAAEEIQGSQPTPHATIRPGQAALQYHSPAAIALWQIQPQISNSAGLVATLQALLDTAHQALRQRRIPACHGVFLDSSSAQDHAPLSDRQGVVLLQPGMAEGVASELLICPKPHIGPWRVDLVHRRQHCCVDPNVCHIIGQVGAQPPIRQPRNQADLIASATTLRNWLRQQTDADSDDDQAEQVRSQLFRSLGELTERYIRLTQADTAQVERTLQEWVFGEYWSDQQHLRGLPQLVRQMLVSGEYVWVQFQNSSVEDWAACAVQYTRALEFEIHRRIYQPCGNRLVTREGTPMGPNQFTIGTVIHLYSMRRQNSNWQTIQEHVVQPSGIDEASMRDLCMAIESVRTARNKVAHTEHVDANLAKHIREQVLGKQGQPGLLIRLAQHLRPPP
ncbi:MAG: hypothetical protein Fur005_34120 [Roseiflexaceae bacterium]